MFGFRMERKGKCVVKTCLVGSWEWNPKFIKPVMTKLPLIKMGFFFFRVELEGTEAETFRCLRGWLRIFFFIPPRIVNLAPVLWTESALGLLISAR